MENHITKKKSQMCETWMQHVAKKMYNAMDKGYKGTKHKVMQKTNNLKEKNCKTQGRGGKIMCGKQRKYTKTNHLKQTLKKKENH